MSDSVGSISVDVVPDASGWAEKLRAQIRDQTVKIRVEADTAEANTKLDELIAKEDDAARTRHAKIDVDSSSVDGASRSLGGFLGNLGLIPTLAVPAVAGLIPLAAVLGGIALALAAPLAIGGGGATLFAFLGGLAVKQTDKQLKNIAQLQTKLNGLTKGTAEYAATSKQLKAAQDALSPSQVKFASALTGLKSAFSGLLTGKTGDALLGPFTQGMQLLTHLLPVAAPLISSVSGALSSLLTDVGDATKGRGFHQFIDQFSRLAGRDIRAGGHILGDLAQGVGSLLLATDKGFSGGFLRGLDHLSSSFSDWASSREARHDMRAFFGYVHDVGPQVGHTLGAIAHAAGKLIEALAPLGPPVLKGIEGMANAIGAIPVPVLTGLAAAFAGAVLASKVSKGLGGLSSLGGLAGGKGGALGGLLSGGVQKVFVVNMGAGGLGGGGPLGDLEKGAGKAGPLKYVPQAALLAAAGYETYQATRGIEHNLSQASKGFGLGAPTLGSAAPPSGAHINYGKLAQEANGYFTSTTNRWDAMKARAAAASRTIDMIGPHADVAFGAASHDVDLFSGKLRAIQDKHVAVILQDQAAVRSLEALQRMRVADKNFNIYAHYQQTERAPGPGGGMGQNPHGSASGGSSGGAGRTPVHIHLDDSGRSTLTGYMDGRAQGVYDDNQRFEGAHG